MRISILPLVLGLFACNNDGKSIVDADGDGFTNAYDCNDGDPNIGLAIKFYLDADADSYGNPTFEVDDCQAPEGFVDNPSDCNDLDPAYHPGAPEDNCGDPNDYNCDGKVTFVDADNDGWAACEDCDDHDPALNPNTVWHRDRDGDGYGNPDTQLITCDPPAGFVLDGSDCNDLDNEIHEDQKWYADSDQDQYGDPGAWVVECHQPDGYVPNADDCDDHDARTNPKRQWYEDADGDGYGDPEAIATQCTQPHGYVPLNTDCDDTSATTAPGMPELCDGIDNDCDTVIDDGAPTEIWYGDNDGDGYGDDRYAVEACDAIPGFADKGGDCNDEDETVNPGATDHVCDGVDWRCDGEAGLVTFAPTSGNAVELSAQFASGNDTVPYVYTPTQGGTLHVCTGTYAAQVVDNPGINLSILGEHGRDATSFDVARAGAVATVNGGTLSVYGVSFERGSGVDGGAVALSGAGAFEMHAGAIYDSLAARGGAIYAPVSTSVLLDGTVIDGNTASVGGGALWIDGTLNVTGGSFVRNAAPDAAIRIAGTAIFTATDFTAESSPADNTPHDIHTSSGANFDFGAGVSVNCSATGCP